MVFLFTQWVKGRFRSASGSRRTPKPGRSGTFMRPPTGTGSSSSSAADWHRFLPEPRPVAPGAAAGSRRRPVPPAGAAGTLPLGENRREHRSDGPAPVSDVGSRAGPRWSGTRPDLPGVARPLVPRPIGASYRRDTRGSDARPTGSLDVDRFEGRVHHTRPLMGRSSAPPPPTRRRAGLFNTPNRQLFVR